MEGVWSVVLLQAVAISNEVLTICLALLKEDLEGRDDGWAKMAISLLFLFNQYLVIIIQTPVCLLKADLSIHY